MTMNQAQNLLHGPEAELDAQFKVRWVDLASERVGGETLACSDDFFAEMENLLKAGRGVFIDDKFTERGKWMDGWESRRIIWLVAYVKHSIAEEYSGIETIPIPYDNGI